MTPNEEPYLCHTGSWSGATHGAEGAALIIEPDEAYCDYSQGPQVRASLDFIESNQYNARRASASAFDGQGNRYDQKDQHWRGNVRSTSISANRYLHEPTPPERPLLNCSWRSRAKMDERTEQAHQDEFDTGSDVFTQQRYHNADHRIDAALQNTGYMQDTQEAPEHDRWISYRHNNSTSEQAPADFWANQSFTNDSHLPQPSSTEIRQNILASSTAPWSTLSTRQDSYDTGLSSQSGSYFDPSATDLLSSLSSYALSIGQDIQGWGEDSGLTLRAGNEVDLTRTQTGPPLYASTPAFNLATTSMNEGVQEPTIVESTRDQLAPFHEGNTPSAETQQPRRSSGVAPSSGSASSQALVCEVCNRRFKNNKDGRGNLVRHQRQKHRGNAISLECTASNCSKKFARSDARLKHMRKRHPELLSSDGRSGTGS